MVKSKKILICIAGILAAVLLVALGSALISEQSVNRANTSVAGGVDSINGDATYTQVSAKGQVSSETLSSLPKDNEIDSDLEGVGYESGKVLITFKDKAFEGDNAVTTTRAPLTSYASQALSKMVTVDESQVERVTDECASVTLREGANVSQAVAEIKKNSSVENVQPNFKYTLAENNLEELSDALDESVATTSSFFSYTATNDPLTIADKQWYISQWNERIRDAWNEVKTNNSVGIAILDTGIDKDHEDLVDNIKEATNVIPDNYGYVNPDGEDIYGHGTNVAGIAAARSNNGIGMTGVSYNANILSVRIFHYMTDGLGATSSDIMKGLEYAISKRDTYNIRVINMSLGVSGYNINNRYPGDYNVFNLVDKAWDAGISCVVASGNDSKTDGTLYAATFPSYYEKCIAVGAVNNGGTRAYFSNGGSELDVVAPGYQTYSTKWSTTTTPTETDKYNYSEKWNTTSGTSFATPYVAGVVALMYTANPNLTPENVYNILVTTTDTDTAKFSNELGYGKVNPYYAVTEAKRISGSAKSYRVFFDVNGGKFNSNVDLAQVVESGKCATSPASVFKNTGTEQTLAGWYTDTALQNKWDFSTPVTEDMTLYAKWTSEACKHTTTTKKADVAATCVSQGKTGDTVCADCGEVITAGQAIEKNPNNHTSLSKVAEKAATCTEDGYSAHQHCNACDQDINKTVYQKKGHNAEAVAATVSTCKTQGVTGKTVCSTCGVTVNEGTKLPLNQNNHINTTKYSAKPATCLEEGHSAYEHCNDCNKDISKTVLTKLEHTRVSEGAVASTCSTHGHSAREICSVCKTVLSVSTELPLDASNHSSLREVAAKESTCTEGGYTSHKHCDGCGLDIGKVETRANGHDLHITIEDATCTHAGLRTTICQNCDYTVSETIPQLDHSYENGYCTTCGAKDPNYVEPDPTPTTFSLNIKSANGITVTPDNSQYTQGQSAKLTISGSTFGNNMIVPSSLKVDGVVVKTRDQLVNKSTWQTTNDIYKKIMKENATIVKFDTVATSLLKGTTIEIANVNETTQVEVTAEELVPVYRLYNTITSEHLFTTNKTEYDDFVKKSETNSDHWIGEGINWFAPSTSSKVVKRLYNPTLGALGRSSHYYTADLKEVVNLIRNHGWQDDGYENQFYSGGDVAIWSCYNEGLGSAHHYTSSKSEWQQLKNHGWDIEEAKNGTTGVFSGVLSALG